MSYNLKNDFYLKNFSILAFILIILNFIVILNTPPESGYCISIYNSYGSLFCFLLIISILIGIVIIVFSIFFNSKYWQCGLFAIFVNYSILIFLPTLRGYFFFATPVHDIFTHLFFVESIVSSGHLDKSLYYPMTHILTVTLYFFGVPLKLCPNLLCVLFTFIYIISFLILGNEIFKNNTYGLFLLAFSIPLMYSFLHYSFIPYFFGLCLIPIVIYCFYKRKSNNLEFTLLTLIFIFSIVFFHPLVTVMLLLFLVTSVLTFYFNKRLLGFSEPASRFGVLIQVILVTFLFWYLNFSNFLGSLSTVIDALFGYEKSVQYSMVEQQLDVVGSSNVSVYVVLQLFIKTYGSIFLYLFLATCCLLTTLKKISNKQVNHVEFFYSMQFIMSILFALMQMFGNFIIHEPVRAVSLAIIISTILCAILFKNLFDSTSSEIQKIKVLIIVVGIVFSASFLGVFNVYEDPWKGVSSPDMTHMEVNGLNWFLENKNSILPIVGPFSLTKYERFSHFQDKNYSWTFLLCDVPSHFGYDMNKTLSKTLNHTGGYMLTSRYTDLKYLGANPNTRYKYPIYSKEDYLNLNKDRTVSKLYMNGEFEVWNF